MGVIALQCSLLGSLQGNEIGAGAGSRESNEAAVSLHWQGQGEASRHFLQKPELGVDGFWGSRVGQCGALQAQELGS